ncbi:MAG: hypothetical protein WA691_04975 [Thermoplasmata archaeon]
MSPSSMNGTTSAHFPRSDLFGGLRRRVLVSLAASAAWLSLTLLYVAFWAHGFSIFQSVVVVVVSLIVLGTVLAGTWVSFGLGWVGRWGD